MQYNGHCACVMITGEKSSGKSFIMDALLDLNPSQGV